MKGNADTYSKGKNTHQYYLEVWPRPLDGEKGKHAKIVRELYARVDTMANRKERLSSYEFNSCEFVGYKFQNTPGVFGNNIALHKEQTIDTKYVKENLLMLNMYSKLENSLKSEGKTIYDGFKDCLLDSCSMIEGFILKRNDDIICDVKYIKVRQNVFTKKGIYEKMKNFGHHNEFDDSGLTVSDLKKKINNHELFYNHFTDQKNENKWKSNYKLKKTNLDILPKFIQENRLKLNDWIIE